MWLWSCHFVECVLLFFILLSTVASLEKTSSYLLWFLHNKHWRQKQPSRLQIYTKGNCKLLLLWLCDDLLDVLKSRKGCDLCIMKKVCLVNLCSQMDCFSMHASVDKEDMSLSFTVVSKRKILLSRSSFTERRGKKKKKIGIWKEKLWRSSSGINSITILLTELLLWKKLALKR